MPKRPSTRLAKDSWAPPSGDAQLPPVRHRARPAASLPATALGEREVVGAASRAHYSANDRHDYAVGYGKPPQHTRFKKGQSGNPGGRPGGSKNFATLLADELGSKVRVREDGKTRTVTKLQAIVMRVTEGALKGEPRAIREIVGLISRLLPHEELARQEGTPLPADDAALLEDFVQRYAKSRS